MRHSGRLTTIPDVVHVAPFPVYGLFDRPLGLSVSVHGQGISHLGNLIHISFSFTSPHYPNIHSLSSYAAQNANFQVMSIDAAVQLPERENMVFDFDGSIFVDYTKTFLQEHQPGANEQQQAGDPLVWEGTFSLSNTSFTSTVLYWDSPLPTATFLLKSETTILMGGAHGPSYEELFHLIESLQIINDRDDVLRQYQYEFVNQEN